MSDTLVSVFRDDPDWSRLSDDVPARVRQAIQVCLQKEPKQRVRDIAAVRLAMEGAFETTLRTPSEPAVEAKFQGWPRTLSAIAGGLALAMVSSFVVWNLTRPDAPRLTPHHRDVDGVEVRRVDEVQLRSVAGPSSVTMLRLGPGACGATLAQLTDLTSGSAATSFATSS